MYAGEYSSVQGGENSQSLTSHNTPLSCIHVAILCDKQTVSSNDPQTRHSLLIYLFIICFFTKKNQCHKRLFLSMSFFICFYLLTVCSCMCYMGTAWLTCGRYRQLQMCTCMIALGPCNHRHYRVLQQPPYCRQSCLATHSCSILSTTDIAYKNYDNSSPSSPLHLLVHLYTFHTMLMPNHSGILTKVNIKKNPTVVIVLVSSWCNVNG